MWTDQVNQSEIAPIIFNVAWYFRNCWTSWICRVYRWEDILLTLGKVHQTGLSSANQRSLWVTAELSPSICQINVGSLKDDGCSRRLLSSSALLLLLLRKGSVIKTKTRSSHTATMCCLRHVPPSPSLELGVCWSFIKAKLRPSPTNSQLTHQLIYF